MSSSAHHAPSVAESSTTKHSTRGRSPGSGHTSRIVTTSPPWAKDEPESPVFDTSERSPRPSRGSTLDPSIISEDPSVSAEPLGDHHRWRFALPRSPPKTKRRRSTDSLSSQSDSEYPIREKRHHLGSSRPSRPRWPTSCKRVFSETLQIPDLETSVSRSSRSETLRVEIPPPPPRIPYTLSHNETPGWESPWTPRVLERAYANDRHLGPETDRSADGNDVGRNKDMSALESDDLNSWQRRRKKLRYYVLHNTYVPLFSRIMNITFTTVTLAIAIRIRIVEQENHIRGAVGSSPVLVIIFAPLTLVHVMIAIYLEYFGRPLGLWRTSAKLAHTLSEVVFICAWSAELALCFDNYFTSPLNCAPRSTVQWYSELAPFSSPLGNNTTGDVRDDANRLCHYQLDLIGVVMVALLLYVTNLVISLFRIFEKVKVHQGWGYGQ